jgi:membrane protease YdiL (CAAX protease family)
VPPPGWMPSPAWPVAPPNWQYWIRPPRQRTPVEVVPLTRRGLVLETWFVELVFLASGIIGAVDLLAAARGGSVNGADNRFPVIVANPVANLFLGMLTYLGDVGAVVPIVLLLLSRTGQRPQVLGLGGPRLRSDILPGIGLGLAMIGLVYVITVPLAPLIDHSKLFNNVTTGSVPAYYVLYGLVISATTSITEETLVNGYLLTRLDQLGWNPRWAFALSLVLRTSYHVYYGLGFLFTIPFGYFVTRSFQKHRRLARPIIAHFLYDGVLLTLSVLLPSALVHLAVPAQLF